MLFDGMQCENVFFSEWRHNDKLLQFPVFDFVWNIYYSWEYLLKEDKNKNFNFPLS